MIIDDGLRIMHDDGAWMMQIYANIEATFPADDPFHGAKHQSEPSNKSLADTRMNQQPKKT